MMKLILYLFQNNFWRK